MSIEKVDILCITAHPDDVEIGMGGTVARHIAQGRSVGLVELTAGELGTPRLLFKTDPAAERASGGIGGGGVI